MSIATAEILIGDIVALLRVYDDGVPSFNPHPYKFQTTAIINNGVAQIKGLDEGAKITTSNLRSMGRAIKELGGVSMWWEHNGKIHRLKL